ncbi:MAG: hypothetical protein ABMA26_11970, partial [Limisphaerales bacterium]
MKQCEVISKQSLVISGYRAFAGLRCGRPNYYLLITNYCFPLAALFLAAALPVRAQNVIQT